MLEGSLEGNSEGMLDGDLEGCLVGNREGLLVGESLGLLVGSSEGLVLGDSERSIEADSRQGPQVPPCRKNEQTSTPSRQMVCRNRPHLSPRLQRGAANTWTDSRVKRNSS